MSYSEKLKDPRWQKKRLKILERDEFTCLHCGDDKSTLHVHHLIYTKNEDPWETDNDYLITLCETCHTDEHDNRDRVDSMLLYKLKQKSWNISDVYDLYSLVHHIPDEFKKFIDEKGFKGYERKKREKELDEVLDANK